MHYITGLERQCCLSLLLKYQQTNSGFLTRFRILLQTERFIFPLRFNFAVNLNNEFRTSFSGKSKILFNLKHLVSLLFSRGLLCLAELLCQPMPVCLNASYTPVKSLNSIYRLVIYGFMIEFLNQLFPTSVLTGTRFKQSIQKLYH